MTIEDRLHMMESRTGITEALYRYCRAIDRFDLDLLRAVFHDDAIVEAGQFNGPVAGFVNAIDIAWGTPGTPWKNTHHTVSNVIIELSGNEAKVESYVVAYHRYEKDGERSDHVAGGRYIDKFQQREDIWRIAHRRTVFDWSRMDPATQDFWAQWDASKFHLGTKDRSDPLYTA